MKKYILAVAVLIGTIACKKEIESSDQSEEKVLVNETQYRTSGENPLGDLIAHAMADVLLTFENLSYEEKDLVVYYAK